MASNDIYVPDIGNFKDVAVIDVLVQPGDSVQVDTPLLTLETEKATMDVPSTAAGVDREAACGERLAGLGRQPDRDAAGGRALAPLRAAPARQPRRPGRRPAPPAAPAAAAQPAAAPAPAVATAAPRRRRAGRGAGAQAAGRRTHRRMPPIDEAGFAHAHASPSVRKFARELGVDLARVTGTGQKGRITDEDVKAFVKR